MNRHPPSLLRQVFYVSRSLADAREVETLVAHARERNRAHAITGALMFTGGHFAQWIEGPPQDLQATLARIESDRRHDAVTRLLEGDSAQRRFDGWTMAFLPAPGADDLIDHMLRWPQPLAPARAQRLLALMVERAEAPNP